MKAASNDQKLQTAQESLLWAFNYFEAMDRANAQVHCAPVKYSPVTFRLCAALWMLLPPNEDATEEMMRVNAHEGAYELDLGR